MQIIIFILSVILTFQQSVLADDHSLKFDYRAFPKEREIAYKYFVTHEYDNIRKESIAIALYDITGSGNKEIIAYSKNYHCGNIGCSFVILSKNPKNDDSYTMLPFEKLEEGNLSLLMSALKIRSGVTNKYHDITVISKYGISIWHWDGSKYTTDRINETHQAQD